MENRETEKEEIFFTRKDGLRFTYIVFKTIIKNKLYEAVFKCSKGSHDFNVRINGKTFLDCYIKVEKFLCTQLEPNEYEMQSKQSSHKGE